MRHILKFIFWYLLAFSLVVLGIYSWTHVDHAVGGWIVAVGLVMILFTSWDEDEDDD